jgi:hypothetical protein
MLQTRSRTLLRQVFLMDYQQQQQQQQRQGSAAGSSRVQTVCLQLAVGMKDAVRM